MARCTLKGTSEIRKGVSQVRYGKRSRSTRQKVASEVRDESVQVLYVRLGLRMRNLIEPPLEECCVDCGISELYAMLIMDSNGVLCKKCLNDRYAEEFGDDDEYEERLTDEQAGR